MSNQKEKMLALLQQLETKGNAKYSFYEMLKDGVIVLVGARIGIAFGKPSLLAGLGATFAGHYFDQPRITTLGLAVMAGGSSKFGLSGTNVGGLEGAKEHLKAIGADLKERLYLDKFIKSKPVNGEEDGTAGLGQVQYFKYPNNELNMAGLDAIEDEIARSGEQFSSRQMAGTYDDVAGPEDRIL